MFKRKLRKFVLSLLTLAVLVGLVLLIRHLNVSRSPELNLYSDAAVPAENGSLPVMEGEGLVLADENDQLQLWVNVTDGNIEVVQKADGYVWRSAPTAEEMALEKSNKLWTANLLAPVMFSYVQEASAANTAYSNTLTEEAEVTVYRLEDGVRVYFDMQVHKATFAYEARLNDTALEVSIPSAFVSDPGEVYKTSSSGRVSLDKDASCLIADFYLFPNLGAARSDTGIDGALLVPDGTGALIDFQSKKFVNSQYIAPVYGSDIALANGYDSTLRAELNKPGVAFPVYGVLREGHTMLAVIDEGETQAAVTASRAGVQTGFNTVSARFTYRMKYKVITNSSTGDGYLNYTSFTVDEPRKIIYSFGTGGYVDMAASYRGYLADKYHLTRTDGGEPALQLHLVGGDVESGMFGDSFIPMTTFEQGGDILSWFADQGVGRMDAVWSGWAKRGESVRYPDRFPAASDLGGNGGLRAFAEKAKGLNTGVYLTDDHLSLVSSSGVSVGRSTVYSIQGYPLFGGAFASSAFMEETFEKDEKQYGSYGLSGLQEQGAGAVLMTDYAPDRALSRSGAAAAQRALIGRMIDDFGSVRLEGSNAYALTDHAVITDLPSSSYLTMLDESIPFYTTALHGLVDYLCGDYMDFHEQRAQLLDAVARGGSISFTLTWEGTEALARADTAAYYSTAFGLWREDVLSVWRELQPYLRATAGQFITGYEMLGNGVSLTAYENGTRVLVNNTDRPFVHEDRTVEARSFLVLEGR